jgi:hypothetical protein
MGLSTEISAPGTFAARSVNILKHIYTYISDDKRSDGQHTNAQVVEKAAESVSSWFHRCRLSISLFLRFSRPEHALILGFFANPTVTNSYCKFDARCKSESVLCSLASAFQSLTGSLHFKQFERIFIVNLPSRTDRRDGLVLMSALTGIKLDWIDGVVGDAVPDKALPPPASHEKIPPANIGSWRAHLNALQAYVQGPFFRHNPGIS